MGFLYHLNKARIMDTSVSTPQAVATVIAIEGQAFARDPSGQMRPLNPGDVLLEGDTIVTMPGGQVQLAFLDGHLLTLLPNETFQFSAETSQTTRPDVSEASLPAGEAGRIIQALERGENIDDLLDPTAAGFEDGGNNSGNDFVRLLRIAEDVTPLAFQFGTRGTPDVIPDIPEAESVASTATSTITPPIVSVTPPPTITHVGDGSINNVTVTEGSSAVFTVNLSNPASTATSFAMTLADGSAVLADDYTNAMVFSNGVTLAGGNISVPAGVTSFTVTVPTVNDTVSEPAEAFTLSIGGVTGTGNITDNDGTPTITHVGDGSINNVTVAEGTSAVFTVNLSNAVIHRHVLRPDPGRRLRRAGRRLYECPGFQRRRDPGRRQCHRPGRRHQLHRHRAHRQRYGQRTG